MNDQDIEDTLNIVKSLFSHMKNKDVFLKNALNLLSYRLLTKSSLNTNMEKMFISKLKIEVGFNSVRKMETMFKDMEQSRDLMNKYKSKDGFDTLVEVLTSG